MIEVLKQALEAIYIELSASTSEELELASEKLCDARESLRQAIAELESQERNFCPRCGKRTNDIHTCTPPMKNI